MSKIFGNFTHSLVYYYKETKPNTTNIPVYRTCTHMYAYMPCFMPDFLLSFCSKCISHWLISGLLDLNGHSQCQWCSSLQMTCKLNCAKRGRVVCKNMLCDPLESHSCFNSGAWGQETGGNRSMYRH